MNVLQFPQEEDEGAGPPLANVDEEKDAGSESVAGGTKEAFRGARGGYQLTLVGTEVGRAVEVRGYVGCHDGWGDALLDADEDLERCMRWPRLRERHFT